MLDTAVVMDTITHSLLGAVTVRALSRTPSCRHTLSKAQLLTTGAVAAAFPDSDYIASWLDPLTYLTVWHRSITHSFIVLPLWALLVGFLLACLFRKRDQWRWFALFAGIAIVSHICSDLITVFGTQIFSPLSNWRGSIGTTFIIDPWFTLIVLSGLIASLRSNSAQLARISLVVLLTYISMHALLKQQALALADHYIDNNKLQALRTTALPQPMSPFNWKLIIDAGDQYHVAYTSLSGGYPFCVESPGFWGSVCRTYQSPAELQWQKIYRHGKDPDMINTVRELWQHPQLDTFRYFAEFPALHRIDKNATRTCIWYTDLRYQLPYMKAPFRYGLCGTGLTMWRLDRLRRFDD